MFIKEPSTFYDSVKPLIYFNRIVGLAFHRKSDPSDNTHSYLKLYTAIVILMNWGLTYIGFIGFADPSEYYDASAATRTMYQVLISTNSGIAVISPFLIRLQQKGLQDCLRRMPILDETFRTILGAQNEYRKQFIRLTCQIMAVVSVTSFLFICDFPWLISKRRTLLNNFAMAFTVHYPIIIILVLDLNFCAFIGYLRKKFHDMNGSLIGLTKNSSSSYSGRKIFGRSRKVSKITPGHRAADMNAEAESLINDKHYLVYEIRKAHLELCKLSRKINHAFGIQNLLSIGMSFTMVTGSLYAIYNNASSENITSRQIEPIVISAMWAFIYGFKIWILNYSCWTVCEEAKRTEDVIYELLESKVDKELQKEIEEFGVQMLQNPVRFNVCGFFTLDYSFVQGVIGTMTTYLVLLIQLSHLSARSTSKTDLA